MADFELTVQHQFEEFVRGLKFFEKDQLPFAAALALTRTAQKGQAIAREQAARAFHLHTKYLANDIRILPAKKADFFSGRMHADIYTGVNASHYLGMHEAGGTKEPTMGLRRNIRPRKNISIPGYDLPEAAISATGRLVDKYKPGTLLARFFAVAAGAAPKKRGKAKKNEAFILHSNGQAMIVRRTGKGRWPLEILFNLEPKARIRPRFGFRTAVMQSVSQEFLPQMHNAMEQAIRTSMKKWMK